MILAFDTSLSDLHIGLFSDDASLLAEYHHESSPEERHLFDALLAKKTSELLDSVSSKAKDISTIVFINGPGSFTGLRIGLAFAKGLAFGSGAKLVPLIAHSVLREKYEKDVEGKIAILYPGYEKDSVYLAGLSEPEKIRYMPIANMLPMNFTEIICPPQLQNISLLHTVISIDLETMAKMAKQSTIDHRPSTSLADLEPFYGTDFKTNS